MPPLTQSEFLALPRKFRFAGGRVKGIRLLRRKQQLECVLILRVRTAIVNLDDEPKNVTIRLRCGGVEEYRFLKRLGGRPGTIADARFGVFDGLYYIDLDAYPLDHGTRPAVHDFRAGDCGLAARSVELVEP
jgi:hypothetical protein